MAEFEVKVNVSESGIGTLNWEATIDSDGLTRAVSAAADDALLSRQLRRLEVSVPSGDHAARRAVMRAGFRQEGILREVLARPDGRFGDVVLYARLAADQVHGPTGFSGVMNSALPRKRAIAHVLIRDAAGRVLLCDTHFKRDWELPGGIVEPFEAPRFGAIREVKEELGIDLELGRLLVVDWMPPYLGWDDALEFIFDGGIVTEDEIERFSLQTSEIKRVRLCTLDEAAPLLTELSHRRLTLAASLQPGQMLYLEDGAATP